MPSWTQDAIAIAAAVACAALFAARGLRSLSSEKPACTRCASCAGKGDAEAARGPIPASALVQRRP